MSLGAPIRNLSRAEALAKGLKRYFDGKPCPRGHVSDKLVVNYTCIQCLHEKHQAKRKVTRDELRAARIAEAIIDALAEPVEDEAPPKRSPKKNRSIRHAILKLRHRQHFTRNAAIVETARATDAYQEALIRKDYRFSPGIPCARGHMSDWYIGKNGAVQCVACNTGKNSLRRKKYPHIPGESKRDYNARRARLLRAENPEKARAKTRSVYQANVQAKLRSVLRSRIKHALKGRTKKPKSALAYLGCSVAEAKAHIEAQFQPGMTWANHGHRGWHIDHVIPLARFDMTDESQRKKAFHYTNLQPLWARHNQVKNKRLLSFAELSELV
jgi:hypothetical protein